MPQTRGNEASVKDLIVSVLSKEWPLNTRKIYNRVAKIYAIPCSYQAVHKSIKKLVKAKVLIQDGREYRLNLQWLDQIKIFSEGVRQEYAAKGVVLELSDTSFSFYSKYLDNYKDKLMQLLKTQVKGLPILYSVMFELDDFDKRVEAGRQKKISDIPFESKNDFLLLGPAGSGKTTALNQIAAKYCRTGKKIPIIYNLTNFSGQSLSTIIRQKIFEVSGERITEEFVEEALNNGAFVFLFDGLNEASGSVLIKGVRTDKYELVLDRLTQIFSSDKYAKNQCIIACRTNSDPKRMLPIPAYALKPFTEKQMRSYLWRRGIPRLFDELKESERLFELCKNPLMLDMTINVYAANTTLPKNRTRLYEKYFSDLLYGWEAKTIKQPELIAVDLEESLSKLAFKTVSQGTMFPMGYFLKTMRLISKELGISRNDEKKLIQAAIKTNLVQIEGTQCRFGHHSFQEFFAAKELLTQFENSNKIKEQQIKELSQDETWIEPLAFLSGLLDDSTALITSLKKYNMFFAGECAITTEKIEPQLRDSVIQGLLKLVNHKDNNIHWRAANVLNRLGERACDLAIETITKGEDIKSKRRLLWVTGHFNNAKIENILLNSLEEKDHHTLIHVLLGLQDLESSSETKPLIKLLRHESPLVRGETVITLEKKMSRKKLSSTIQKKLSSVRKDSMPLITKTLKDKEYWARMHAALVLGKMKAREAVPSLIDALADENFSVRWHAVLALSKIGDDKTVETLESKISKAKLETKESMVKAIAAIKNRVEDRQDLIKSWRN